MASTAPKGTEKGNRKDKTKGNKKNKGTKKRKRDEREKGKTGSIKIRMPAVVVYRNIG